MGDGVVRGLPAPVGEDRPVAAAVGELDGVETQQDPIFGLHIPVTVPGVDAKLLIKDAAKLMPLSSRRTFLRGAASLGALTVLTGCDILDGDAAEGVLRKISAMNDGVQAALFSNTKLAPEFPESAITKPFPFNAYYAEDEAPEVDGQDYKLEVGKGGYEGEVRYLKPSLQNTKDGLSFGFGGKPIVVTLTKLPGADDTAVPEGDAAEFKNLKNAANGEDPGAPSSIKANLAAVREKVAALTQRFPVYR